MNYYRGNYDGIKDKTVEIVSEHLGLKRDAISMEKAFVDDYGADSLDIVELTMAFEEEFGINIPDEELEKFMTVKNCVDFIFQMTHGY